MNACYLVIVEGPDRGTRFALSEDRTYVTGRRPDNALPVKDDFCSIEHARLVFEDGQWTITDLESRNGTYVNEYKIRSTTLASGDRIRCGRTVFILSDSPDGVSPTLEAASDERDSVMWVREAREGDEVAVKRLITLYHSRLRARIAQKMDPRLRRLIEPEDILQHAYVEAFSRVESFDHRGPGAFYQWLVTMAENKLADEHRAIRAKKRDVARESRSTGDPLGSNYEELLDRIGDDEPTPSQLVRDDEAKGLLLACLAKLPEHYREVLQLRYLEERPVAEVAAVMNRGDGAVAMLCQRALKQLRVAMNEAMT